MEQAPKLDLPPIAFKPEFNSTGLPVLSIYCGGSVLSMEGININELDDSSRIQIENTLRSLEILRLQNAELLKKSTVELTTTEQEIPRPAWLTLEYERAASFLNSLKNLLQLTYNQETILLIFAKAIELCKAGEALGNYKVDPTLRSKFINSSVDYINQVGGMLNLLQNILLSVEIDNESRAILLNQFDQTNKDVMLEYQKNNSNPIFMSPGSMYFSIYKTLTGSILGTILMSPIFKLNNQIVDQKILTQEVRKYRLTRFTELDHISSDIYYGLVDLYNSYRCSDPEVSINQLNETLKDLASQSNTEES